MAEMDAKTLKEFDDRLKSMVGTLGELEGNIKAVGTAITNSFGTATQNMVKEVQQAFRGIQMSDMLGVDLAKRDIQELNKEIAILEGNIKTKTSNGTASYSPKKNKWVYTKGNEKLTDEGEVEAIEKLNRLNEKLKYSMMSREELMLRLKQTSGKMYSDEQRDLKKLQQEYYNYEQRVKIAAQNIDAYKKSGSDSQQTKDQITFWKKQSDDYTTLMKSAQDRIKEYREKGIKLSLEEEERMRLAQLEKLNRIENNKLGYASKEWKKETSQRTKRNADLDKRADEYRKSIEALTKAELELAQAEDNLHKKQAGKANGQPYAENTIKGAEKSVAVAKQNIIEAEEATKRFGASLASLKGGAQRLNEIRAAFGLIAESGQEAQKIPTVFDRVIAEINSRSERSKVQLAKSIEDAKSVRDEAKAAAANVANELSYIWKGASVHGLDALKLRSTFSLTDFGVQGIANQIKLSDQYKANLDALKPEAREKLTEALNRYKEALQQVIFLEEKKRRFDENTDKYSAQERAINGVTKRYQENEQAIQKLKDRWEEMNVKKQAGLINEKDFKQNTQTILDEYDKLINKRKEFEVGDLGEMSTERQRAKMEKKQFLAQIRKDDERLRVQDELNADKKIAAERARRARGLASTDPNMNAAVKKQIQYQRQLTSLRKEYNTLNAKQNRTKEENIILEQTKQKIKDIINLSRQLNNEQKGSHNLAKQITDYDRIKQKIREANESIKELNDSTKKIISTAKRLSSAFGVAFSVRSLVNFGKKLIETRGEFEIQQVALRSILQNKQLADEIWEKTMSAALQSPFTAMQLTRYTKQLSAYRIETEKLFDTTKRLADVSAGLGVDMGRLILAYGQVKAANYLRASEIRQFTEAGVNILGELRDYFNETKGMAISTADVMDKVQKRLVKFEDVEAIFKRLTDQGGIFYNMQYIQSQTLKGQINKLHDAYDQMLNDIGKSNQGVLKEFVDTFNSIVKNWRTWSVVIKSIAFGGITVYITRLAQAIGVLSIKGSKASKSIKSLAVDLRKLGRVLKENVTSIGIGSIVAVITTFIALGSRMRENNKVIEEQLLRLRDTRVGFEKLESKIKANNSKIQNGTKNQKELNKAQKENKAILAKLKDEYPQLASQMSIATNGVIDMNNALTIQNRKLREQASLIAMQSQQNLFSDTMQQNLQEAEGELIKKRAAIARIQAEAKTELAKIEAEAFKLPEKEANDLLYSEKAQILKEIVDFKETDDVIKDLNKLAELDLKFSSSNWIKNVNIALDNALNNPLPYRESTYSFVNLEDFADFNIGNVREQLEEQLPLIAKYYEQAIMDNKTYAEEIKKTSGGFEEWLSKNVDRLNKDAEEGINKANETIIKVFKATTPEGRRMISEAINSYFKIGKGDAVEKAADDLGKVMAQGVSRGFSAEWAKEVKEKSTILSNVKKLIDFFAESTKGSNGGDGSGDESKGDKQKKSVSSMVSLLKEMNDEYNKLSKSAYGFSKSQEKVKSSFESAFKEVYKGLGMKKGEGMILSFDKTDFTTKTGLASAYEQLLAYVTAPERIGKYTKEAASQIEKALADVRASIGVDVQVRIREDFEREMEDAFNNYELTLDLQKLNLPSDLMEDMFNIESVDMTTLRQKITDFYNELKAAGDVDRDDMAKVEQYIKKIDDMEKKAQRDRIKEYAKYLEYELSERAKISMDYAKKIADVQTERSIPVDKRDKIIAGLIKERDEKLAKQDWEDFKGSEVYVQMMEDLEKHGTAALKSMREELELIRKNAKNLSPRALKEVVNAIEKIREIELNRVDPFTGLRKSIANVKESLAEAGVSSKKELYAEAAANEKNLVLTQRRKQEVDRIVAAQNRAVEIQKELNDLTKYKEISDIVYNSDIPVEKEIDAFQDLLKKYEDDFNKLSDEDKKLVKERLALAKEMGRLNDEASKDTTTSARKEEIKARATEIENRVKEIDKLLDGTVIGQNIANGIIDAIKRVIELKGEFMGISSEDLANVNAKKEQKELSETEKRLQSLQNKYNKAIQDIDNYNKQVQRLVSKISEWAGVVQGLWSDITNMSSAYEGGFGKWMNRWGKVIDVSLQQVSKLSKAFGDFRNTMAEVEKSATKEAFDNAMDSMSNVNKATETAEQGASTAATTANTIATKENTAAKLENAAASGLASAGNTAVGATAEAATPAVATFGSTLMAVMGWVGLIAAGLSALMSVITSIAGAHDDDIEEDIEREQRKIDELKRAYERLEKQIQKTWSSLDYMDTYDRQVENIKRQIEATERQLALERDKKDTDESKIISYQEAIDDAYDELDELKQKQIEVFGGIGEEGYRSAAEGFVDAWKEAFLETGDGLQGLQDHFDEFLQEWFVKQATMRIAGKMLERTFRMIDDSVNKSSEGGVSVTMAELQAIRDEFAAQAPLISEALEDLAGMFDLQGEGGLSGLAAGIQGMTEEQANILEAYWNSVRMYTANIDVNVERIASILGAGGINTNPMLDKLDSIINNTSYIKRIYDMLEPLQTNNGSGRGFRTYNL